MAVSAALSWPGGGSGVLQQGGPDEGQNLRTAYNLAAHGAFSDAPAWTPGIPAYMHREPGYPVFLALVFATVPGPMPHPECVLDPQCGEGAPFRDRHRQAELAVVAAAVAATFLAALALTRAWPLALAAGVLALVLIESNYGGNALAGILLCAHAVFAWRAWNRPGVRDAAIAGLSLGAAVLVEAALQYWLLGLAGLCAAGLWREPARRPPLAKASVVMLLAAFLPAGLWMARNQAVAGQFTVSGRQGEVLAIRAEYAHATWSEIGGLFALNMPRMRLVGGSPLKKIVMRRLRPKDFGYARIRPQPAETGNLAAFYVRALHAAHRPTSPKASHSKVARRADLLEPGWRERPLPDRDRVLRAASVQLIAENWPKHLATSAAFALLGSDYRCRLPEGFGVVFREAYRVLVCQTSNLAGLLFVPAGIALLAVACRRRDVALALLVSPVVYFFALHALATHFLARLAQPAMPLMVAVSMLALQAGAAHVRRRRSRSSGATAPVPAGAAPPAGALAGNLLRALAAVAILGGAGTWFLLIRFDSAPGPTTDERVVVIPPGQGLKAIARRLAAEGVVANPHLFVFGVALRGDAGRLQAGEYAFPAGSTMGEAARLMVQGRTLVRQLTVPEGESSARVAARIRDAEGLAGRIVGAPAEGTLLPETYFYRRGETREAVAGRMQEAMRQALREAWDRRAPNLPLAGPEEALVLASIIEKETGVPEERARVAAVFANRLRKGMRLQSDPTVSYGIGRADPAASGRALTGADLERDHPWNTYRIRGLPPTPIANPGRASLLAAVRPAEVDDLYFVADGTGGHVFAATLEEHNRNVARWRALRRSGRQEAVPEE